MNIPEQQLTPDYQDKDFTVESVKGIGFPHLLRSEMTKGFGLLGKDYEYWSDIIREFVGGRYLDKGLADMFIGQYHYIEDCLFDLLIETADKLLDEASEEDIRNWGFGYLIHKI